MTGALWAGFGQGVLQAMGQDRSTARGMANSMLPSQYYDPSALLNIYGTMQQQMREEVFAKDDTAKAELHAAMEAARKMDNLQELEEKMEEGCPDLLMGAYFCRIKELQSELSPVGKLIAERIIETWKGAV